MYQNIPLELQERRQWVCWRYEQTADGRQTKVPYTPDLRHASVTDASTWCSFDEAVEAARAVNVNGIGFVLSSSDPYCIIDLDNKIDKPITAEEWTQHEFILNKFASYTERSVSGRGYHIVIRAKLATGRRRNNVEVYSTERYMVFTGDVVRNAPITDYQEMVESLVAAMPTTGAAIALNDVEAVMTDSEVHEVAISAVNGDKYDALCVGDWAAMGYTSQSEADLALLSILAFYSRDNAQVRRMFRYSGLGKRSKAVDNDTYLNRTLQKIRAKQAPPTDFEAARANAEAIVSASKAETPVPAAPVAPAPIAPATHAPTRTSARAGAYTLPPGLVGELAQYFYSTAHRPVQEVALAAAIGIVAGVAGRSYNISGTGLNQYLLVLAKTGTGKESMASGINQLVATVRKSVPNAEDFLGPSSFASGQGLIRVLDQRPCFVSILGEFGLTLQSMNDPRAPSAMVVLRKVLLDLYGKSGWSAMLRSTAYSDTEKNTKLIHAPAVTILGESTPETFYDGIDAGDISDGLIPRFHIVEYKGLRPDRNRQAGHAPSTELTQRFADLATIALTCQNNMSCAQVQLAPDGLVLLDEFDMECDTHMRASYHAGETQLWNRAHLKALKLAGLLAVGCNPHAPVVTAELAQWAIDFTRTGTKQVLKRFDMGDVGSGDAKQQSEIRRVIKEYIDADSKALQTYRIKPEWHKAGLIPYSYFVVRTSRVASFYKDRLGSARALQNALDVLIKTDALGVVSPVDCLNKFNCKQALYYIGQTW